MTKCYESKSVYIKYKNRCELNKVDTGLVNCCPDAIDQHNKGHPHIHDVVRDDYCTICDNFIINNYIIM